MPSQCLLVGMQVPFGHWKPLHFFSEIQNRWMLSGFFLKLPLVSYKKTWHSPRCLLSASSCFWRDGDRPPEFGAGLSPRVCRNPSRPAAEPPRHASLVTAVGGVLVGAVLAVGVAVAGPALRDAVAVLALEAGGLAGVIYC